MRRSCLLAVFLLGGAASLNACAAQPVTAAVEPAPTILIESSPAPGSTVPSAVDELKLRFNPPARLEEVTVSGRDGLMPMMVHPVGEVADYSLPLSGLGRGDYRVTWRATSGGRSYSGSFTFTAK